MSCTRNASGSATEAKPSLTASAIAARSSLVARSAARPTTPTSSTRRDSNISPSLNPWSAARYRSGSLPSVGGPTATNVPAPCRVSTTPRAASDCSAARTVGRLTPTCVARSRSAARRWPERRSPASIKRRTYATTCSVASGSDGLPRLTISAGDVIPLQSQNRRSRRLDGGHIRARRRHELVAPSGADGLQVAQVAADADGAGARGEKRADGLERDAAGRDERNVRQWRLEGPEIARAADGAARKHLHEVGA